jgi:predicted transcriptional regulator
VRISCLTFPAWGVHWEHKRWSLEVQRTKGTRRDLLRRDGVSDKSELIELVADVVAAYVGSNKIERNDLPGLVHSVHQAFASLANGTVSAPEPAPLTPAVPIKKSITPEFLICLEDGKKFKSLKRHLRSRYNLTPDEYRARWGLPADYPMVAPNYAQARSRLAKEMGLGQLRQKGSA